MGLVRGHIVSEETRGAMNGKVIGNGRGVVVRTSLSMHVVQPLVDLGTAMGGILRLRVHMMVYVNRWSSIRVIWVGHAIRNRSIRIMIVAVRGRLPRSHGIRCVSVIRTINTMRVRNVGVRIVRMLNVGVRIVCTLNMATVTRGSHIGMRVLLLDFLTKDTLVPISGLCPHWCHDSGAVKLSRVQRLVIIGLHFEDQVSILDVRLTGAEGR